MDACWRSCPHPVHADLPAPVPPCSQVRGVPPSEAKVFTEYVLPSLSLLPSEAELAVQVGGRAGRQGRETLAGPCCPEDVQGWAGGWHALNAHLWCVHPTCPCAGPLNRTYSNLCQVRGCSEALKLLTPSSCPLPGRIRLVHCPAGGHGPGLPGAAAGGRPGCDGIIARLVTPVVAQSSTGRAWFQVVTGWLSVLLCCPQRRRLQPLAQSAGGGTGSAAPAAGSGSTSSSALLLNFDEEVRVGTCCKVLQVQRSV